MKLVVTGTYVQFLDYCRETGLNPHSRPKTVKYVQSYEDFFGLDNGEVVFYGEYHDNPIYQNAELWEFFMEYAKSKSWEIRSV